MACDRETALHFARQAYRQESAAYASFSGADHTDAERHRLRGKAFERIANGEPLETVLADMRAAWVDYCKEIDTKIARAPKIKRGPMAGCSSIHYKYCFPGRIDGDEIFIRTVLTSC